MDAFKLSLKAVVNPIAASSARSPAARTPNGTPTLSNPLSGDISAIYSTKMLSSSVACVPNSDNNTEWPNITDGTDSTLPSSELGGSSNEPQRQRIFTSDWDENPRMLYRAAAFLCGPSQCDGIRKVVNPSKDTQVDEVALRHQLYPVAFSESPANSDVCGGMGFNARSPLSQWQAF